MSEHFKIGDLVYLVKDGIVLSNVQHRVVGKQDGCVQIENTQNGWKSWWKRDRITKKVITIAYKTEV